MDSGLLKYVFTWVSMKSIRNGYDIEYTETEKDIKAYLMRKSGNKGEDNNERFTNTNITFKFRNHYDIQYTDIIKYKGDKYDINNILPSYDNIWCEISISKIND